jgi:hypothetical protein
MNSKDDWRTLVWRHYGAGAYDEVKFKPAEHRAWNKPTGGLWVSPRDSEHSWAQWCMAEQFNIERLEAYFDLTIHPDSRTFVIDSCEDAKGLPWHPMPGMDEGNFRFLQPDWKAIIMDGWDMIILTAKGEVETRFGEPSLYGWDCESGVILNPQIILPCQRGKPSPHARLWPF